MKRRLSPTEVKRFGDLKPWSQFCLVFGTVTKHPGQDVYEKVPAYPRGKSVARDRWGREWYPRPETEVVLYLFD